MQRIGDVLTQCHCKICAAGAKAMATLLKAAQSLIEEARASTSGGRATPAVSMDRQQWDILVRHRAVHALEHRLRAIAGAACLSFGVVGLEAVCYYYFFLKARIVDLCTKPAHPTLQSVFRMAIKLPSSPLRARSRHEGTILIRQFSSASPPPVFPAAKKGVSATQCGQGAVLEAVRGLSMPFVILGGPKVTRAQTRCLNG